SSAAAAAHCAELLRRALLGLVAEVLVLAVLPGGAVAVEKARLAGRHRAVARRRALVAAVEDPAPQSDDAIPHTRPGEWLKRAVLPLDAEHAGRVSGPRQVRVGGIERDVEDRVAGHVRGGEIAPGVAVEGVDGAV